jgi:hypothetical protein
MFGFPLCVEKCWRQSCDLETKVLVLKIIRVLLVKVLLLVSQPLSKVLVLLSRSFVKVLARSWS